jgi:hypothetical protein
MKKISPFNCSIGIVTYLGRFETYFKALIKKLYFLFPDYDILIFINGHYDTTKQISYLRNVTSFLQNYPSIRYVTNIEHQSLASAWNWLVLMARCSQVLLLNDDVSFQWSFRYYLEKLQPIPEIFTLNRTWSHVVVSKDIIRKVGWFDERFRGTGYEDTDFVIRLALKGIPIDDRKIHGLENIHDCLAPLEDVGWANFSRPTSENRSELNKNFFEEKWGGLSPGNQAEPEAVKIFAVGMEWLINPNRALQEVPQFYPMSILANNPVYRPAIGARLRGHFAKTLGYLSSIYWQSRLTMGAWGRKLLGPRWEQWRQRLKT